MPLAGLLPNGSAHFISTNALRALVEIVIEILFAGAKIEIIFISISSYLKFRIFEHKTNCLDKDHNDRVQLSRDENMGTVEVVNKLELYINEINDCTLDKEYEDLKLRIKSFLINIYGESHFYSKDCVLAQEIELQDYAGLNNHFNKNTRRWVQYDDSNRKLTKDRLPLINFIRRLQNNIQKDGLPSESTLILSIKADNSPGANFAINYQGHITQTANMNMSDFNNYYDPAIEEIKQANVLDENQKEELIDLLSYFKENQDKNIKPSFAKKLKDYILDASSIGANVVALLDYIKQYI